VVGTTIIAIVIWRENEGDSNSGGKEEEEEATRNSSHKVAEDETHAPSPKRNATCP
jgi:hypothetical protein